MNQEHQGIVLKQRRSCWEDRRQQYSSVSNATRPQYPIKYAFQNFNSLHDECLSVENSRECYQDTDKYTTDTQNYCSISRCSCDTCTNPSHISLIDKITFHEGTRKVSFGTVTVNHVPDYFTSSRFEESCIPSKGTYQVMTYTVESYEKHHRCI
jgi:hypothetical protein